jgi:ABC-type transporter Mla MlaB component
MDETHTEVMAGGSKRASASEPERPAVAALTVRTERLADVLVIWLSGALDKATSGLLDREFDEQAGHATNVVVDVTGLRLIDFSGLDTLVRTQRRAWENNQRTSFRHGPYAGRLPSELTDSVDRRFGRRLSEAKPEDQRDLLCARHGVR